jgi:hypothetical protein
MTVNFITIGALVGLAVPIYLVFERNQTITKTESPVWDIVTSTIIGDTYTKLKKDKLLKKIKISKNYTLTFSIRPKGKLPGWTNIIRSTISNERSCCNPGDRLPGIWFWGASTNLYIINSVPGGFHRGAGRRQPKSFHSSTRTTFRY